MKKTSEWRGAAAVVAAVAGAGFSSGREVVLFFAQMGWASWIGVGFAAAMFGLLCAVVCHFARTTGARSFQEVYRRVLDVRQGTVVGAIHGLLMALTAGVMAVAAGEMAALALPIRGAFWMGMFFTTGLALLMSTREMRGMALLGVPSLALCGLFYLALALDPRSVTIYMNYETVPEMSGSVTAAILLATLHAALNASIAGGVTACFARRVGSPMRFGARCGGMMLLLLSASNAAVLRGGEKLFSQALPTVVLAARWGKFGYYGCILVMWLCALTTLAAVLGSLACQMDDSPSSRRMLLIVLLAGTLLAFWMGFERFIELGYPMLGWASVFAMAGLACYYDRTEIRRAAVANHDKTMC